MIDGWNGYPVARYEAHEEPIGFYDAHGNRAKCGDAIAVHINISTSEQLPVLPHMPKVEIVSISGEHAPRYKGVQIDLSPLANLPNVRELEITCHAVSDVSPIASLSELRRLIIWSHALSDLSLIPLARLHQLRKLSIVSNAVSDLSLVGGLPHLEALFIRSKGLSRIDLGGIAAALKTVEFNHCSITSLTGLSFAPNLTQITATGCEHLADLRIVPVFTKLSTIKIWGSQKLVELRPVSASKSIRSIEIHHCWTLSNIAPLVQIEGLRELILIGCEAVIDHTPLDHAKGLRVTVRSQAIPKATFYMPTDEERRRGFDTHPGTRSQGETMTKLKMHHLEERDRELRRRRLFFAASLLLLLLGAALVVT